MRRLQFLIWTALLFEVTLLGCRTQKTNSSEQSPSAAPASVAVPPDAQSSQISASSTPDATIANLPVVAAFGDSLTAGYGAPVGKSYPDYLQQQLLAQGYHYRVANLGISGNTSKDGVDRIDDVLRLHPVLVIVAFGGNDGLRGVPIAETRANMETIVSKLLASGTKVVLGGITLPRNYGDQYIQQFDETYTMLASKHHLPLIPFLLVNVYGTPGGMQEDGIHATALGNEQVARNIFPLVAPLLKKSR